MYEFAIVTFLDILGFREFVHKSPPEEVSRILDIFQYFAGADDAVRQEYPPTIFTFSDSIIRVRHVESDANIRHPIGLLFDELLDLLHAQGGIIQNGLLIRGGLTVGKVAVSSNRVFGPAFIEAHELESRFAQYPRIVVSANALSALENCRLLVSYGNSPDHDKESIQGLLRQGDDGMWFIDYLYAFQSELDAPEFYLPFLKQHRDIVLSADLGDEVLSSKSVKYNWLASYHNMRIDELPEHWLEENSVSRDDLKITPADLQSLYSF